jgi:hypothetical protein
LTNTAFSLVSAARGSGGWSRENHKDFIVVIWRLLDDAAGQAAGAKTLDDIGEMP